MNKTSLKKINYENRFEIELLYLSRVGVEYTYVFNDLRL
jgi:hypothetical protein